MEQDSRLAELKQTEKQLQEELPSREQLKLARHAHALAKELHADYGDQAGHFVSITAFQLGQLLISVNGDLAEIEQLFLLSLEGFAKLYQQDARMEHLLVQAEVSQLLTLLCAQQMRGREALAYGKRALQHFEQVDELAPGELTPIHSHFWGLLAEVYEDYASKKAHKEHVNQQLSYYQSRLESSPITASALLAVIEHCASRMYEHNGQPRKTLHAKIAAVTWQKQYHELSQKPVDHNLINYLASLATCYHEQGNDKRALALIVELVELSQRYDISEENTLSLIAHSYILRVHLCKMLRLSKEARAYCIDAIEQLTSLSDSAQQDETRATILHHLYEMTHVYYEDLCQLKAQPEKCLAVALDGLKCMREAYELAGSADYANELQSALLTCGDCYAASKQRREARACYREVTQIHNDLFDGMQSDGMMDFKSGLFAQLFGDEGGFSALMSSTPDQKSQEMRDDAQRKLQRL